MITELAVSMSAEDVKCLAFVQGIPMDGEFSTLELLIKLEKKGVIGPNKVQELSDMLADINRYDLICGIVQPYLSKYPPGKAAVSSNVYSRHQNKVPVLLP